MRIVSGFIHRNLIGERLAIPTGEAAQRLSGLMELNESGKFLIDLLEQDRTEQELLDAFLDSYEIDEDTARADIREVLDLLQENNLLIP